MKSLNHQPPEIDKDSSSIFNGVTRKPQTDIELITITPTIHTSYTSLRDVIGEASSPSAPASPSWKSCRDVAFPIRNPLVKQAAISYLQPLSSPPIDDRSWTEKMKANLNRCFVGDAEGVEVGCMSPLNGVVLAPIKDVLGRILRAFSTTEDHHD